MSSAGGMGDGVSGGGLGGVGGVTRPAGSGRGDSGDALAKTSQSSSPQSGEYSLVKFSTDQVEYVEDDLSRVSSLSLQVSTAGVTPPLAGSSVGVDGGRDDTSTTVFPHSVGAADAPADCAGDGELGGVGWRSLVGVFAAASAPWVRPHAARCSSYRRRAASVRFWALFNALRACVAPRSDVVGADWARCLSALALCSVKWSHKSSEWVTLLCRAKMRD